MSEIGSRFVDDHMSLVRAGFTARIGVVTAAMSAMLSDEHPLADRRQQLVEHVRAHSTAALETASSQSGHGLAGALAMQKLARRWELRSYFLSTYGLSPGTDEGLGLIDSSELGASENLASRFHYAQQAFGKQYRRIAREERGQLFALDPGGYRRRSETVKPIADRVVPVVRLPVAVGTLAAALLPGIGDGSPDRSPPLPWHPEDPEVAQAVEAAGTAGVHEVRKVARTLRGLT